MVSGNGAGDGLRHAKPESGAMERLRDRMIQELRIRGKAERTVEAYVHDMRLMTERTGLLPGRVTEQDIKAYLEDLREVRQVAPSSFAQHVAAIRFFYTHVLRREFPILDEARAQRRRVLPDVLTVNRTIEQHSRPAKRSAPGPQRSTTPWYRRSGRPRPSPGPPQASPRRWPTPSAPSQPLQRPPLHGILTAARGDCGPFTTP